MKSVGQIVKQTLAGAESFFARNEHNKSALTTYGYFVRHPVAPLNRKRLTAILNTIESTFKSTNRPLRVLDLACGGGIITCAIAGLGHRVLGFDLSEEEINLAKLFAKEEGMDASFIQADLLNSTQWVSQAEDFLGGKPDIITLAYALHHLPQVEGFIEKLGNWLDSGATLLVNEENPHAPLFRFKHLVRTWLQNDTATEWHRTFPAWKEMLEFSGFRVIDPPIGLDMIPALGRIMPRRCWSLVFAARRN